MGPAKEYGSKNVASNFFVDDMLYYGQIAKQLLEYFRTVVDVMKHHQNTLKLKKCKWFQDRCEFVGMDVVAGVTQPAHSKNEVFVNIERHTTLVDLCMIIGIFVLYIQFFPVYDLDIRPCRYIFF